MEKTIKYPNGKTPYSKEKITIKKINTSKARLGINFEEALNDSNLYYLNKNIAAIYKKPTPIQVVKVDYPSRNKARITEAYYKTPSTTDYNGIYKKKYIDFEAKSCKESNFSFERIYEHQINHLKNINDLGGISFLIIEFSSLNEIYILHSELLYQLFVESKSGGRKSIPYSFFKENGYKVEIGYAPRIDYLTAVDKMIKKENQG